MPEPEPKHDAAAVELGAGWIAICATCGWVSESYGPEQRAVADSARHVAEAPAPEATTLAFLADARRASSRDAPSAGAA
jgi:hypothetical protein